MDENDSLAKVDMACAWPMPERSRGARPNCSDCRSGWPPALLIEQHEQRRLKAVGQIEARLDEIKIDWLVEKFNELLEALRERFIKLVSGGR